MRILVTVPHYYKPQPGALYGSQGRSDVATRLAAIEHAIAALHQTFGPAQAMLKLFGRQGLTANDALAAVLDVVICTAGEAHLVHELGLSPQLYRHHRTEARPMFLGFECHALLREALGQYDFYCFLEDDLILRDPMFFLKLQWFTQHAGEACLLQPNRFELSPRARFSKVYIDGAIARRTTSAFQDIHAGAALTLSVMGSEIRFERPLNPHAGCFFLNHAQMEHWSRQPFFLSRDARFVGPLESAASLGIMQAFRVYKPARQNAGFLEIQHSGSAFLDLLGTRFHPDSDLLARCPPAS